MASVSGAKRPHSPASSEGETLFVPQEDLTARNFGTRDELTDRQYFAWAYQTETKVRLQKLEARKSDDSTHSKTLNTDYLIDIYPKGAGKKDLELFENELERDRLLFRRKALDSMRTTREPDGTIRPIDIIGYDREEKLSKSQKEIKPVPPNYLYFLIVLEAYCGYDLRGLYNSNDAAMPRAAMMGGAVVAALTSWRDPFIKRQIEGLLEGFLTGQHSDSDKEEQNAMYVSKKQSLVVALNDHFLEYMGDISPFAPGDVDVFLQTSPLTWQITNSFNPDIAEHIWSFLGGVGLCHEDLHRFTSNTLGRLDGIFGRDGKFVYALAKNGISTMFAPYKANDEDLDDKIWPRCTQFIMLSPQADLVGAVMDFDLSLTSCTFDGTTVRVTPRAALSLQRMIVVVTPFCFEERRNRKRIVKYFRRGFDAAIIDQNCLHPTECSHCDARIEKQSSPRLEQLDLLKSGVYKSAELRSPEEYNNILTLLRESIENGQQPMYCCHTIEAARWHAAQWYTMALFEKSPGHALDFFAKNFHWSEEMKAEAEAIPSQLRMACQECRREYAMRLFLAEESPVETLEDVLHGEKVFSYSYGHSGFFHPSFYSGGVFDSTRFKSNARDIHVAYSALSGQSRAERIRYILAHGTEDGYLKRFLFSPEAPDVTKQYWKNLVKLFQEASQVNFPCSSRAPVGLNPERFVSQCQDCSKWLIGYEFGTELCNQCANKKPSAA